MKLELAFGTSFPSSPSRIKSTDAVHLVGYSMGARLALGILAEHPELWEDGTIRGATLIGVNPGLEPEDRAARKDLR